MSHLSMSFSEEQLQRYARQIVLPEIGGKGQRRLLDSRIAVVGAGGLGSPVLLYLAAAGVGTIDVIDDDKVSLDNLHRQVIHGTPDTGRAKTDSAEEALGRLNPGVRVVKHALRLEEGNAEELLSPAQAVLDGSDNFPTRYLVNDVCMRIARPLVSGAMFRFEGQLTVFPMVRGGGMPCYRCLYPEPPPEGAVPTCREAGVLGMLPGVIGSLMAAEAIKVILGIGEPLAGRLCLYDALAARFREIKVPRRPECPAPH